MSAQDKHYIHWHCNVCGAKGKINGDAHVFAGFNLMVRQHHKRAPHCHSFVPYQLVVHRISEPPSEPALVLGVDK